VWGGTDPAAGAGSGKVRALFEARRTTYGLAEFTFLSKRRSGKHGEAKSCGIHYSSDLRKQAISIFRTALSAADPAKALTDPHFNG